MTFNDVPIDYSNHYPNALPPGTVLKGVYKVMDVLGQGSFGITYLAVTPEDQSFAIKEYFHKAYCERSADNSMSYSSNAEGAQEVIDGFRNFTNEAANLTRIYSENQRRAETARSQQRHDLLAEENYNIVRVVESFEENKTSYLVMEYLDGGNLLQKLNKPIPEDLAVSIIIPIAWAVQHLHDNLIMHKDIKPENIMMRSGNLLEPKLIDFGTTLHYDRSGKLTTKSIGAALGTDNYCSLEHSATSRLTPHLDVYSLGATLFHMVTGSPRDPWGDRPQPNLVMGHIKESLVKANVSERVRMAILQAMDNDPNSRTRTAREFIENLNSPFLPLGSILESPNGNRYRILSVEGQEQNYLSYKAERLLKDAPTSISGTEPIDKVSDGSIYTVHENFAKGLCHRGENQCVTSNRGHWPKQDYLAHVKEHVGLVKIPSISVDKQDNPLAEMFTANGTIYSVKRKKSGLSRLFSSEKSTNIQHTSNNQTKPKFTWKRWIWIAATALGIIVISLIVVKFTSHRVYYDAEPAPENESPQDPIQKLLDDMVYVEGGSFMMGIDAAHEAGGEIDGYLMSIGFPAHNVTLSDFLICKYEVTQELWKAVMGETHSRYNVGGPHYPVDYVTWEDCQEFIDKLNKMTGLSYRLPTEAEWEFAARGGNKGQGYTFSGSNSPDDVAVYGQQNNNIHGNPYSTVGSMGPNELGIYDMSGNVTEWCQDWFGLYGFDDESNPKGPKSGKERVIRTGGVDPLLGPGNSVADRTRETETAKEGGLRLALDADVNVALARAPEAPAE